MYLPRKKMKRTREIVMSLEIIIDESTLFNLFFLNRKYL